MQTVLDILNKAGGWHPGLYLKIDNAPYMELVIEAVDESGPCGLPALSVCHYGKQNGDAMRDPEMMFELGFACGAHLDPYYWRNDYVGVEQWSRFIRDSDYCYHRQLFMQHVDFAKVWEPDFLTEADKAFTAPEPQKGGKPRLVKSTPKKAPAKKTAAKKTPAKNKAA